MKSLSCHDVDRYDQGGLACETLFDQFPGLQTCDSYHCGAQCRQCAAVTLCPSCTGLGIKGHTYVPYVTTLRQQTCLHMYGCL